MSVQADALKACDLAYAFVTGNQNRVTQAMSQIGMISQLDLIPALLADTVVGFATHSLGGTLQTVRYDLLEKIDTIREIALAIEIPDGGRVFKMSREDRNKAYETLRDYQRKKGTNHIRKVVVIESSLPGNWGSSLDDGLIAYANAKCPSVWIAYDVHAQAYVTSSGSLRLDNEDNGRNLTDAEAFVEICRVE